MIQADVFYAYGLGALMATSGVSARVTIGYHAVVFAPTATVLLGLFPGWQTMHMLTGPPPWWLAGSAFVAYVAMAALGHRLGSSRQAMLGFGLMYAVFAIGHRRVPSPTAPTSPPGPCAPSATASPPGSPPR